MFSSSVILARNQQGLEKLLAFLCIMRYSLLLGSTPSGIAGVYDTDDARCLSSFFPVVCSSFEVLLFFTFGFD